MDFNIESHIDHVRSVFHDSDFSNIYFTADPDIAKAEKDRSLASFLVSSMDLNKDPVMFPTLMSLRKAFMLILRLIIWIFLELWTSFDAGSLCVYTVCAALEVMLLYATTQGMYVYHIPRF